jgi:hypothetical protein
MEPGEVKEFGGKIVCEKSPQTDLVRLKYVRMDLVTVQTNVQD